MRETTGGNAPEVAKVAAFSQAHGVDLRTVGFAETAFAETARFIKVSALIR
jgi:hypothetical protein